MEESQDFPQNIMKMFQRIFSLSRCLFLLLCLSAILVACFPSPQEGTSSVELIPPAPTDTVQSIALEPTPVYTIVPAPNTPSSTETPAPTETLAPTSTVTAVSSGPSPSENKIAGIEINPKAADADLSLVEQAGAGWIRINALIWSDVEPFEGRRDWDAIQYLDNLLIQASAQGLETILIVRGTPLWARIDQGSQCGRIQETKFNAFGNFMADLVERYSVPPYNVKYWEIWNEPDVDPAIVRFDSIYGCWGDPGDIYYGGQNFGALLKTIYPAIKAAQFDVKVVVGGLLLDCDPINPPEWPAGSGNFKDCSSSRFLDGILESGAGDSFDAVSFHAYDYYGGELGVYGNSNWNSAWNTTGPLLINKTKYLLDLLTRFDLKKELLNTENALICGSSEATCASETYDLTKAYYAAISLGAGRMLGLTSNVWYSISGWRESGLVGRGYQPLPVFDSYRFAIQELDQAVFLRVVDEYPGLTGFEFMRDDTKIWLIWSQAEAGKVVHLPESPDAVYDVFGNTLSPQQELSVAIAPAYLEWLP